MPPFPLLLWMDTTSTSASSSVLAGPPSLWRLAVRRSRKAGSGNIFSDVNLWQLQRLFRAAGDQDAEQRAQLVWGLGDEAELARALIGLKARSQKRGLRTNGRDVLGSHWLRAFNHLRIGEGSSSSQGEDADGETDSEAGAQRSSELCRCTSGGATGRGRTAAEERGESQGPEGASEKQIRTGSGLRRRGESNPERYLHQILH